MANRRWLKIGSGIAATITTVVGLFILFSLIYNFQIVDLTGDFFCKGTYHNPCISEFEVKNPNSYNVDIYSNDQIKLEFSPEVEDYALFVEDGRCSATGKCVCELKNNKTIGFDGWRCVDFTNKTKPRQDREYNFRFSSYSTTKFRLAGIKKNPGDEVKWTFGINETELDPVWKGKEGGGVIIPNIINYRIHDDSDYFEAYLEKNKLIIEPLRETSETLNIRKAEIKSKLISKEPETITKQNGRFELELDRKSKYYEIENQNITIEGISDISCGEYCVAYFDINAPREGMGFESYLIGEGRKGVYWNNSGELIPIRNESNFTFEEGEIYSFMIVVGKKENADIKWGIKAFGEELDPEFFGSRPIMITYADSTQGDVSYGNVTYAGSISSGVTPAMGDGLGDIAFTEIINHPFETEKLMMVVTSNEKIYGGFWTPSGWGSFTEIDADTRDANGDIYGVAYEQDSGNAMIAWAREAIADDDYVWYSVWEGSSWSAPAQVDNQDIGNQVESVQLYPRPGTDEIMVIAIDSVDALWAFQWTGSAWGVTTQLESDLEDSTQTALIERPFDCAWWADGSKFICHYQTEANIQVNIFNGISWEGEFGLAEFDTNDCTWLELESSYFENRISGACFDDGRDVWLYNVNSTGGLDSLSSELTNVRSTIGLDTMPFAIVHPAVERYAYFYSTVSDTYILNDSRDFGNAVLITANNGLHFKADQSNVGDGMAAVLFQDNGADTQIYIWNSTSGVGVFVDDIGTISEENWNHDISFNQYEPPPPFEPNVTICKELDTANKVYLLQNDIQDLEGDCIVITANNVTLDGQGHVINFSLLGTGETFDIIGGIRIQDHNAVVKNVTVTTYDTELSGNAVGIWVDSYGAGFSVQNVTIQNAIVDGGDNLAVLYDIEGINHKIINSYATNPDQFVFIEYLTSNVLWENITYEVGTGGSFGTLALYESNNSVVRNMQSDDSLAILHVAEGDNVKNATIINSDFGSGSVNLESDTDYIFINTTYGEENVNGGNLTRKWYFGFQINDSNTNQGIYIPLWTLDDKDNEIATGSTDANGYQASFPVIAYTNKSGVTDNRNPHTIQATKTGYLTNTTEFTLNTNVFLQLWTATVPSVTGVLNLPKFQFGICSPDFENASAQPIGQTPTVGTINLTNEGGTAGTARIKYTGTISDGWILYVANSSQTQIELSGAYQNIVNLDPSETEMIWMYANCSYVHANPGVNIDFDII